MKKYRDLLFIFFLGIALFFAQKTTAKVQDHHHAVFQKPDAFLANIVIWVCVFIVIVALVLSIKYIVKPNENDPNHIKNIVKDEGF